ncbi:MAG: Cof-type HAD-IIB family hydrolase [Chloroflexota bacterium]
MTIKLVALDLDGTVLVDWHTVTDGVQAAVKRASAQGAKVVLATGREYPGATTFYKLLGLTTPVVCFQGALVYDPQTDTTLVENGLTQELTEQVITLGREKGLAVYIYGRFATYVENGSEMGNELLGGIGTPLTHVPDLEQILDFAPLKIIIIHPAEDVPALMAELRQRLDSRAVTVTRSLDVAIEMVAPVVSKGTAVAAVAAHYGIAQQETMAVGDQDNDVEMLEWAAVSVAMGNGSPLAKAAADVVAPSKHEDGVVWAIEQYVLQS